MSEPCEVCGNVGIVIMDTLVRRARFCECPAGLAFAVAMVDGLKDVEAGRTRPWWEIKRELGLSADAAHEEESHE